MNKILIVEDDKFLANAYRLKLTKSGFETTIVADGEDAFEVLKNYTPDLIILDLILPRKDGFTLLEEIKANNALKSIPIIIASNLGQKEDIEKGLKLGAADYIIKSDFSMGEIIGKIKSCLNNEKKSSA